MTEQRDSVTAAEVTDEDLRVLAGRMNFANRFDDGDLVKKTRLYLAALRRERDEHANYCADALEKLAAAEAAIAKKDAALREIAAEPECGCSPCTGQCRSQEALAIQLGEIRQTALDALAPAAQRETCHLTRDEQQMLGKALRASTTFVRDVEPAPAPRDAVDTADTIAPAPSAGEKRAAIIEECAKMVDLQARVIGANIGSSIWSALHGAAVSVRSLKDEPPRLAAAPTTGEPEEPLRDPLVVHMNMLRGGIAKLTPAAIGHLYRGDEAKAVVAEVVRQNPEAFPTTGEPT